MTTHTIFEKLKSIYGTHSDVARVIGIDPRLYRQWRQLGRMPEPARRLAIMLLGGSSDEFPNPYIQASNDSMDSQIIDQTA